MNSFPTYNADLVNKELADETHQKLKFKSLVQLDILREEIFLNVMEPTASVKEKLALAEHLVKSTLLEAEAKKAAEVPPTFNFGFNFQSPSGEVKTVGSVIEGQSSVGRPEPLAVESKAPDVMEWDTSEVYEFGGFVGE